MLAYGIVILFGLIALVGSIALVLYSKWEAEPANRCEIINGCVYCDKVPYTGNIIINKRAYKYVYSFINGILGSINFQMNDGAQVIYITPHFTIWRIIDADRNTIDKATFEALYHIKVEPNASPYFVALTEKYGKFAELIYQ